MEHSFNTKMHKNPRGGALSSLIISCIAILILCAVFGLSFAQFIKNSSNPVNAFNSVDDSNAVTVPQLWNSSTQSFNRDAMSTLLKYISSDGSINGVNTNEQTATDIRGYTYGGKSSGRAVVVQLGNYQWQVVYLTRTNNTSGDRIATLLMVDSDEASTFSNGGYDMGDNWNGVYPTNMYSTSYIRVYTLNTGGTYANASNSNMSPTSTLSYTQDPEHKYALYTVDSQGLTNYLVQPKNVWYQTLSQSGSIFNHPLNNESLATNLSGYNDNKTYQTNPRYAEWGNDYLWLPSLSEVGYDNRFGIWELSEVELSSSLDWWTRTGVENNTNGVFNLSLSTSNYLLNVVNLSFGVRPALHLNLDKVVQSVPYIISATADTQSTVDKNSLNYAFTSNAEVTFTFTANPNYIINRVRLGSTTVSSIPTTIPSSFTNAGIFQYKVYRVNNSNSVNVILKSLTDDLNISCSTQQYFIITTENAAVTINSYSRTNYYSTTATITVQQNTAYTQHCFRLPGRNWIYISSTIYGDGYIGDIYYNFTNENNIITVYFENLTVGSVFEVIFSGDEKPLSYTATGGTATFEEFIDDEGYTNVIVRPAEGYYVNTITVDNVAFTVEYYRAEIMGAGNARIIGYTVKDTNNVLDLWLVGQYDNSNIVFNLSTTRPTYRVPATGGAVTGTVVTAGAGGEARIVGFDSSDTADTDTLTFIAVSYSGYAFSGWEVDGQILSGYGSNASIPYSLVKDKVVTAVFTPTSNNSANGSTDNPWGSDIA